ncbi:MAG: BsaA family SipW-dependent biofilm matrix protein [Ruminococcus sp.]|nr:BsaA family SipW-dependent biofilm matrix protein [Ruminococcus sp.]
MTNNNKKKSSKEKRVLIGALCVAAVMVAGSTFAWFTSKDEVTNRLTATADYGVSIVEDFTPPEDWVPGQTINKDVSAVNTGNVEAFVRLGLLHDAKLTVKGTGVAIPANTAAANSATKTTWVELKKNANTETNTPSGGNDVDDNANEVSLLQAGGTLVVAAGNVVTPSDEWNERSGDDSTLPDYSGAGQYKPSKTGLYIFKRTVYEGTDGATTKYSGYYYIASGTDGADDATDKKGTGTYYGLETEPGTVYIANIASDAIVEDANGVVTLKTTDALNNIKLATTKEVTIANNADSPAFTIAWMKDNTTAAAADKSDTTIIRLTYAGDITAGDNAAIDDVVIDINLASGWASNWTYKAATSSKVNAKNDVGYFFYNKLLAPGKTTEKLVDSVTLNSAVTQEAYKDLVYDLTVVLDSIQVTPDEAKTDTSYVVGVNSENWGATASKSGDTISWT